MLAVELLLLVMVGAALTPDSPLGRWLIAEPAKALARLTPRGALMSLLAVAILFALVASAPELLPLFGLADLSMIADVTALMLLAGVATRFRAARTVTVNFTRRAVALLRRMARARRPRLARPRRPSRDDPSPDPGWAFA